MKAIRGALLFVGLLLALGGIFLIGVSIGTATGNVGRSLQSPSGVGAACSARSRETRVQRLDRSELPYQCGLVFFYHVPSTGGATINTWLRDQYCVAESVNVRDELMSVDKDLKQNVKCVLNESDATYFTHWSRKEDGSAAKNAQKVFLHGRKNKHGGMEEFVQNIGPCEWRVSHCHHSSMHLNVTEDYLSRWRATVEAQGCAFIANVMFRDPLSHALSLYKHVKRFKSDREEWTKHLETTSEQGYWQTQLDYFLYNIIARNPDGVDKDTKIERALGILSRHFDIVTVGEHERYQAELLAMTGWEDREMRRHNTYTRELTFTKKEVEALQELLEENGDTEFMQEVKKMYRKP